MPEPAEPTTFRGMPAWGFAFPGESRDRLTALALDGTKTATAGHGVDHVIDGSMPSRPGDRQVLLDSADRPVAIVEITRTELSTISLVTDDFARAEGEGFVDAAAVFANFEMMNRVAEGTGIPVPRQAIEQEAEMMGVLGLYEMLANKIAP